ncbi:MAG: hypothetical protein ACI857_002469 [Arenicella sp.]|jgi:hypothetical protein
MLYILFLSSPLVSNGCGWWPSGEQLRFSLFSSHMADLPDAYPLFYNTHYFNDYMADAYYGPTENLNEWFDYLGGEVSRDDIDRLIYSFALDKPMKGIENNELMKHFKAGKHLEASEYIIFAKTVEEKLDWDPWSDEEVDVLGLEKLANFGETKMNQTTDQYLKLRYAYQLVVIHYYLADADKSKYFHTKYVMTSAQESVIKTWSAFYQACNTSGHINRLYELSLIFDKCKSKTRFIYGAFSKDEAEYDKVLAKCKNDKEKAVVLSIQAFKNPGKALYQIKKIVNLDPSSELIDLLLIREINKMEDWYYSDYYSSYGSGIGQSCWECEAFKFIKEKNFKTDKAYLKSVLAYGETITSKETRLNRPIWFTSMSYMSFMLDDKKKTEKYSNLAKGNRPNSKVSGQIYMIDLLTFVKYEDGWGEEFQHELMTQLIEMDKFKADIYRYDRFKSELMLAISRRYLEKEEVVLAALFESKVKGEVTERHNYWDHAGGYQAFDLLNENASSKDMDELFELWSKDNKTVLEKFLLADLKPFKWRLTDLWATSYFREDNLEKALKIYETIPDSVWTTTNSDLHYYYSEELENDPFETNIHGKSYDTEAEFTYTKPELVREMIRLKSNLEGDGKDKAHAAFLLGNAYYNMTVGGNSYYYTEYSIGGYMGKINRDQSNYRYPHRALKYYKLAETYSENDKYAALSHRMQLKCKYEIAHESADWKEAEKKSERDWLAFLDKYPNDAPRLMGCDYLIYYTDAWKN